MIGAIYLDSWTDIPLCIIEVDGRDYRFEWSDRFGWMELNKDGTSSNRDFSKRVGAAVQAWFDQGKRMDGQRCIWEWHKEPKREKVHLGGKHYLVLREEQEIEG